MPPEAVCKLDGPLGFAGKPVPALCFASPAGGAGLLQTRNPRKLANEEKRTVKAMPAEYVDLPIYHDELTAEPVSSLATKEG
jgi:hypothetical protein